MVVHIPMLGLKEVAVLTVDGYAGAVAAPHGRGCRHQSAVDGEGCVVMRVGVVVAKVSHGHKEPCLVQHTAPTRLHVPLYG